MITRITVRGALPREKISALTVLRPDDVKILKRHYLIPGRVLHLSLYPSGRNGRICALVTFHFLLQASLFVTIGFIAHVKYYSRLRREVEWRNP
ncbi:MAG: hypothetical protein Q8P50_11655 [Bacillota bacterium]|nr:hypothetical protein [Bacillota bacterium]